MEQLAAYDLWIADYTGKVGWTGPYGMWQRSAEGRLEAIGGGKVDVDLNTAYKDYPTIIRAAGLNGFGETEDLPAKDDLSARAEALAAEGKLVAAQELAPVYLRPPQAERLRMERQSRAKDT